MSNKKLKVLLKESSVLTISKNLAKYVNVFMVYRIYTNLESTICYHASCDQLSLMVWETTRILETVGFKVRTWVCDGVTPNKHSSGSVEF